MARGREKERGREREGGREREREGKREREGGGKEGGGEREGEGVRERVRTFSDRCAQLPSLNHIKSGQLETHPPITIRFCCFVLSVSSTTLSCAMYM